MKKVSVMPLNREALNMHAALVHTIPVCEMLLACREELRIITTDCPHVHFVAASA